MTATEPCPLCGSPASERRRLDGLGTSRDLLALGAFDVVFCEGCRVARTEPLPRFDALVIAPDVGSPVLGPLQRRLLRRFVAERVRRVRPLLPRDRAPRVLDVGAGACAFANAMAASGCEVIAFEPNAANAGSAAAGVTFVAKLFDEGSVRDAGVADASVDAITMWHSLEHMTDPGRALTLARRLLRPGGVIHVSVPNLDSMQRVLTGNLWCYLDVPHHVSHFTTDGLSQSLARAGFREAKFRMWCEEYEVFGFYQSLLNVVTRSHNYFYNRAKKGRHSDEGPSPAWTRTATALGPLFLPLAVLLSWLAAAIGRPACAEAHALNPAAQ